MSLLQGSAPNLRPSRRRAQDLELRLGLSKNAALSDRSSSAQAITIVVEDDDDDVRVSSPRSVAQARSSACSRHNRPVHIPILDDEDLELRLGPAGLGPSILRHEPAGARSEMSFPLPSLPKLPGALPDPFLNGAMDTMQTNEEFQGNHIVSWKRKQLQASEPSKELKLTCAICMDTMKDETSTVCGHIFCKKCIMTVMKAQKKCPTCRKKLANNQIHRIYLSGSTS